MSDETKTVEPGTEPKTFTQEDVNKFVAERAARVKAQYADYDEVKKQAETLAAEKKKREDSELSELEKVNKELERIRAENAELAKDKQWRSDYEKREAERIEVLMKDLDEVQKDIVQSLPLEKRAIAIEQYTKSTPGSPEGGKGGKTNFNELGHDDLSEIKRKYGLSSLQYREALKKKFTQK